jgi:MEDS: MEthanogen/methylotroph, DcmR Sensory domain
MWKGRNDQVMLASEVSRQPGSGDHLIQAYTSDVYLGTVVADYVRAGFERQEAAILVAMPAHVALVTERLARSGSDVPAALAERRLLFLDAGQTLAQILLNGRPDRDRFLTAITAALDHVRPGPRGVRLYGEMVDLLWSQSLDAAVELECLWNELLSDARLSLLCAYRLDPLDRNAQGVLRQVTRCHSDLLPVEQHEQLERAVERAFAEVFGVEGDVATLRSLMLGVQAIWTAMPPALAAVLALDVMPEAIASDVRTRILRHYAQGRLAATIRA